MSVTPPNRSPFWIVPTLCVGAWLVAIAGLLTNTGAPREAVPDRDGSQRVIPITASPTLDSQLRRVGAARTTIREPYFIGRLYAVNSEFDPLIREISYAHDVDAALVKAVVHAESAFVSEATSLDGARGLMQLMPGTASRYAVQDLDDPHQNLRAGVRHLKYLLEQFDGDESLAVAAYNAGEYAVKRFDGIPPYTETLVYVGKVLGLRSLYATNTEMH